MLQDQSFEPRALDVEDDEVSWLVVCKMLDHLGLCTDAATDGSRAVERALYINYQIIFIGLMMPRMGGREGKKAILRSELERWINPESIFAISASVSSAEILSFLNIGFSGALLKPIRLNKTRNFMSSAGIFNGPNSNFTPISEADRC